MSEPTVRSEVAEMLRSAQVYLYPDKIDELAKITEEMRGTHDLDVKQLDGKDITAKQYLARMGVNHDRFMDKAKAILGDQDFKKLFGDDIGGGIPIDDALFLSENHETRLGRFYYRMKHELSAKVHLIRHHLGRATSRRTTAGP